MPGTKVWYRSQYYFRINDFSFDIPNENRLKNNDLGLWLFCSGRVLRFLTDFIDEEK